MALAAAAIAIVIATLRPSAVRYPPTPWYCLVCGSLGGVDVVLNVALFVPLGAALWAVGARRKRAMFVGFTATLLVELLQLTVIPGRDAALGDILTNTVGTLLGYELARTWRTWTLPRRPLAIRLAIGASFAWLAILALSILLLAPAAVDGSLVIAPRPRSAFMDPFDGAIVSLVVDGRPADANQPTERDAGSFAGPALDVVLTERRGGTSDSGVIVRIGGATTDDELAILARVGEHATFRARTRGMDFGLRGPTLRLADVFAERDRREDAAVHVTASRSGWELRATADERLSARAELRAASGWTLLTPFRIPLGRSANWINVAWIAALSAPLGYWLACVASAGAARRAVIVPCLLLAVVGLWGVPWLLGAPGATATDSLGVAAGFALGALLASRTTRAARVA